MAFYEDDLLDEFFILDDFATTVTNVSTGNKFRAIFDSLHEQYSDGESVISTQNIQLTARSVDVDGLDQTSELKVTNVTYRVRDLEPDGTGITIVKLYLT